MEKRRTGKITAEMLRMKETANQLKRLEKYRSLIIKELIWIEQNLEDKRSDSDMINERIAQFILMLQTSMK